MLVRAALAPLGHAVRAKIDAKFTKKENAGQFLLFLFL